jgi:hypothetical protein
MNYLRFDIALDNMDENIGLSQESKSKQRSSLHITHQEIA